MSKTAVVLFNLGGPDEPGAVRPFLFNLFNDPAIIAAPRAVRWALAHWISRRRAPAARKIYDQLGGASPLLANTQVQARALEAALGEEARVFIAMRYWTPRSDETARAVKAYGPGRIVLLPLYPHYSTTTSASSLADWARAAARVGLGAPTSGICCYPRAPGFVEEVAARLRPAMARAARAGRVRVLFSAHGLPEKIVAGGDPYQWQVEESARAIAVAVGDDALDWRVCYQSRVGPLQWIGPQTSEEIARAGRDGVALVVVPIAFVSEHSETLVELDMDYADLARQAGVPAYVRVPTVGVGARFIAALAELVRAAAARAGALSSGEGRRICPASCRRCPLETGG